jgi:two-component system, NarL family, sensor histidine kinase UhpB
LKKCYFLALLLLFTEISYAQRKSIDSLVQILNQHSRDSIGSRVLLALAIEYSRTNVPKAKNYLYQLRNLTKELGETTRLGSIYSLLTQLHQNTGLPDSALYYLNLNARLRDQFSDNIRININYYSSAGLLYKNQGKFKEALPYMLEGLKYAYQTNERENIAGQLLNIGNCYSNLGDLVSAADYHLKALRDFEEIKNKRGQSFCYQGLGNDFFLLKQYTKAETYFKKSLTLKEELRDDRGLVSAKLSLGKLYLTLAEFQLAENYFKQAASKAGEMKLVIEQSRIAHELGILYTRTNQTELARESFLKSLGIAKASGDSVLAASIEAELLNLKNQAVAKQTDESAYLKGVETSVLAGSKITTIARYRDLATYYENTKQYDKALEAFKKYEALNDSVKGNEALIQLKHVEELYFSEKKEQEIALLKKEQELQALTISRQRSNITVIIIALISVVIISLLLINRYRIMNRTNRLLEMERMRNTIARDLHDDLGSTLSSINILSRLALTENNGHAQNYFQRIHDHSSKMMESMSDIVWSINPKHDSLEQVLIKIKEFAAEILEPKNISYAFTGIDAIKNITLNVAQRKNIFLIFKEAINNAAKYSEGTRVDFQVAIHENSIQFSICDNGKGFAEDHVKSGNGLRNMETRAQDMSGKLKRVAAPGKGTSITLEVPIT